MMKILEMKGIEPIAISDNVKLKEKFQVSIFGFDNGTEVRAIEDFESYPNKNQILWSITKNKGQTAEIHKIYYIEDIPF